MPQEYTVHMEARNTTVGGRLKEQGSFLMVFPQLLGNAKDVVLPHGRKKPRFELLRERYTLVPRRMPRRTAECLCKSLTALSH